MFVSTPCKTVYDLQCGVEKDCPSFLLQDQRIEDVRRRLPNSHNSFRPRCTARSRAQHVEDVEIPLSRLCRCLWMNAHSGFNLYSDVLYINFSTLPELKCYAFLESTLRTLLLAVSDFARTLSSSSHSHVLLRLPLLSLSSVNASAAAAPRLELDPLPPAISSCSVSPPLRTTNM